MALFQKSVLNKFIKSQDNAKIEAAYLRFSDIFLQSGRQSEIRSMKEEEYQDGFLDDLFVNILGYIKRPNTGFNLVREKKNEADSKKADGAILKNDSPLAVIELKGTDTSDLDKVTNQGFGYKNNHKECVYVVISNFEKLRFFIHHAVDYIEFNLFALSKEDFTTLWLCLHSDNLLDNIPAKIKAESVVKEEDITKNLYKDYSAFKQELWQSIVNLNPEGEPLMYYKKTQKLIDRFLFIFFAEDAGLLPPNSISRMVDRWKMLKEEDAYKPLYEIFKQYFSYINTGRPGKTPQDEIFAYNGGLMIEDDVLESITISDEVLLKHVSRLTTYDFSSEVDVNILGHIFENSLNDIEAVTAELEGKEIDKSKTKRKKDGVFYTPKYITKYIVDNTVGKLCDEKKLELNIIDEEYAIGRNNRKKEIRKKLDENLQAYRNWLLNITICDPACGSGAFLNQALEYLMEEHRYIDELESQLLGAGFTFPGVENYILENNIFGVDINDESIEIAKLSLWLRTAQRGRKLTSLNNNIKCGNSLIDDPVVAGDKAFNWQNEFPEVFANGGFDVVIGNPPWGAKLEEKILYCLEKKYPIITRKISDTYMYFMCLSLNIIKAEGMLALIVPNTWLLINNASSFRKYLLNYKIIEITDHGDAVFDDAIVESATIILSKTLDIDQVVIASKYRNQVEIIKHQVNKKIWLEDELHRIVVDLKIESYSLIKKMENLSKPFDHSSEIIFGIKPYQIGHGVPPQTKEMLETRIYHSSKKENVGWYPLVTGTDVNRYFLNFGGNQFIHYGKWLMYPSNEGKIKNNKILLRRTSDDLRAAYDEECFYPQNSLFIITSSYDLKYLLCLFNSKLFDYIYKAKCPQVGKVFAEIKPSIIKTLPIAKLNEEKQPIFIEKAGLMLSLIKELQIESQKFHRSLERKFALTELSKKLHDWHLLSYADFIKELAKKKIKLSLSDEAEWETYFTCEVKKALELKAQIEKTDKEIDRMVYDLYELTQEEIKIVEES